jgi:hypothetical protein
MRALVIKMWSITDSRRLNQVEDGVNPREAVLDFVFLVAESNLAIPNIGIPDAKGNSFVCIAA